jgi:hypothetical protein
MSGSMILPKGQIVYVHVDPSASVANRKAA